MSEKQVLALLVVWAVFVAVRNTVLDNSDWAYWFLLALGAICLFLAGMTHERISRRESP